MAIAEIAGVIGSRLISYKIYEPQDREPLLALIRRSDNTDRTSETWEGNPMTAALALDDGALIGAVPFERRVFAVGEGRSIPLLWVTAAHVDDGYRSRGIGAALLEFAKSRFQSQFQGFGVYREDETSQAYRWYAREGFAPLMKILAYRKTVDTQMRPVPGVEILRDIGRVEALEGELLACHARVAGASGGFPVRAAGFWRRVFTAHYYRAFVDYSLLTLRDYGSIKAYALLGRTSMRDGVDRLDILEFVAEPGGDADLLQRALEAHAAEAGVPEVRIQLSDREPQRDWALQSGYVYRDRDTNILGKLFSSGPFPRLAPWRYFQVDYI